MNQKIFSLIWVVAVLGVACDDDEPVLENEEELITTLNLTFTPVAGAGSAVETATWSDIDGPGGANPVIDEINLEANTTYNMEVEVLNESETPAEDVTIEIRDEDDEHQFFYVLSGTSGITITYDDTDGTYPVGLENTVGTTGVTSGTLSVILRHEPNKSASGVSAGDPTNAGGETDIETLPPFDIVVQ